MWLLWLNDVDFVNKFRKLTFKIASGRLTVATYLVDASAVGGTKNMHFALTAFLSTKLCYSV